MTYRKGLTLEQEYGLERAREIRQKLSEAKKGKPSPNKNKKFTEDHRKRLSLAYKGKKLTQGHKMKISLSMEGGNSSSFKKNDLRISKQNNPNWQGGISIGMNLLRRSSKMKFWRRSVLRRDKHICQECGIKEAHLNVHHEVYVNECIKLGMEELIFDIDNGTTLCKPCHQDFHRKEG